MKNKFSIGFWPAPDEVIAKFGPVRLVRRGDGRHDLVGGTRSQRLAARAWCAGHTPFIEFAVSKCPRRRDFRLCRAATARILALFPPGHSPPYSVFDAGPLAKTQLPARLREGDHRGQNSGKAKA